MMLCRFPRQASLICTPRVYTNLTQCAAWTRSSSRWQALTISPRLNTPLATESRGTESTGVWGGGCLASGGLRQGGYGEHYAGYRYGVDEEGLEAAYDAGAYGTQYEGYGGEPAYDSEPCDEHFDG